MPGETLLNVTDDTEGTRQSASGGDKPGRTPVNRKALLIWGVSMALVVAATIVLGVMNRAEAAPATTVAFRQVRTAAPSTTHTALPTSATAPTRVAAAPRRHHPDRPHPAGDPGRQLWA